MAAIGLEAIAAMAQNTIDNLPLSYREHAALVALNVVDWPDQEVLADLGIGNAFDLTGLYQGIPLTEKSVSDPSPIPDAIWIFREPILAEWRARGDIDLGDLVTHVVVHELAHHFGWSDDDIATIDRWWE